MGSVTSWTREREDVRSARRSIAFKIDVPSIASSDAILGPRFPPGPLAQPELEEKVRNRHSPVRTVGDSISDPQCLDGQDSYRGTCRGGFGSRRSWHDLRHQPSRRLMAARADPD